MSSLTRAVAIVALGILAAGCPASHPPVDSRPPCPEGGDFGNECSQQDDCEPSVCGRVAGVCIDYTWTCGACDFCFFEMNEHVEDTFLPCDPTTGFCTY